MLSGLSRCFSRVSIDRLIVAFDMSCLDSLDGDLLDTGDDLKEKSLEEERFSEFDLFSPESVNLSAEFAVSLRDNLAFLGNVAVL